MDDVDKQRHKYIQAAGQHEYLKNGVAAAVIPLTAWAVYHGLSSTGDGTKKLLQFAGVTGAGLYATSVYFYSAPRERAYFAGSYALGCLSLQYAPYLIPNAEYKLFYGSFEKLSAQYAVADKSLTVLQAAVAGITGKTGSSAISLKRYKQQEDIALRNLKFARGLLGRSNDFFAHANEGNTLRRRANSMVDRINQELVQTEPDPSALAALTRNLIGFAGNFGLSDVTAVTSGASVQNVTFSFVTGVDIAGPASARAQAKRGTKKSNGANKTEAEQESDESDADEIRAAVRKLNDAAQDADTAIQQLVEDFEPLRRYLSRASTTAQSVRTESGCFPVAKQSPLELVGDNPGKLKEGGTIQYGVVGATGIPKALIGGSFSSTEATVAVNVQQSVNYMVAVTASGVKAGTVINLRVSDADGSGAKEVQIDVVTAVGDTGKAQDCKAKSLDAGAFWPTLTVAQRQAVEKNLKADVDTGIYGPQVCGQIEAVQACLKSDQTGQLDKVLYDNLTANDAATKSCVDGLKSLVHAAAAAGAGGNKNDVAQKKDAGGGGGNGVPAANHAGNKDEKK